MDLSFGPKTIIIIIIINFNSKINHNTYGIIYGNQRLQITCHLKLHTLSSSYPKSISPSSVLYCSGLAIKEPSNLESRSLRSLAYLTQEYQIPKVLPFLSLFLHTPSSLSLSLFMALFYGGCFCCNLFLYI